MQEKREDMKQMRKQKNKIIVMWMITLSVLCFSFIGNGIDSKAAAKSDARIVDYDSGSRTERFHFGRSLGATVNVTVIGDKESMTVTNVKFITSDSTVCSVKKVSNYYQLSFLKEGIAVITMTCQADGVSVEKKLLASCLTPVDDLEGILKANSVAYRGCSDKEGISSKNTEVKDRVKNNENVTIDGMCGNYYRVWLDEGEFGDSGEDWAYVKKQDVMIPLMDINIPEEMSMYEDTEQYMEVEYIPSMTSDNDVTWKSSNTNVVKVDEKGKLTAGKSGSAIVTVTSKSDSEISSKCRVTVKPYIHVTGIEIIPKELNIDDGEEGNLTVKVLPEDASNQRYKIEVSDENIIRVTAKGYYTAMKPGNTIVTVISEEGGYTDQCNVNVKYVNATGVEIQKTMDMCIGEVVIPDWNMIPTTATNKNVRWSSSNPSIVSVDKLGRCTGKGEGKARISLTTEEGGYTAYCDVTVKDCVYDIQFHKREINMTLDTGMQLKYTIYPMETRNKKIVWRSDNPNVVSVDNTGKIKAKKTGMAEILVYDRYYGAYDICYVHVDANLNTPKLKVKKTKKNYILSWKKVKHATSYVLYQYKKESKKYKKVKTLDSKTVSIKMSKSKKGNKYKLKAYYKPNEEYSHFSDAIKIK